MSLSEQFSCILPKGCIAGRIYNKNANATPIIVVSGGPGLTYHYLLNIAALLSDHPVIFYDAIGVGESSPIVHEKDWHLDNFVAEIHALREYFELNEFILLGHSAGTISAIDYALNFQQYLCGLILISPVISIHRYKNNLLQLISQFPQDMHQTFTALMQGENVDPMTLMEAMAHFSEQHMFCKFEWPDDLLTSSANVNAIMRDYLWGKNDFSLTGVWRDHDRLSALDSIQCRTLITCGQHDFIGADDCRLYADQMSNATFTLLQDVSHNPHLEDPAQFRQVMTAWLYNQSVTAPEGSTHNIAW